MNQLKPIRSEADYEAALKRIEPYFDDEPVPGTPEADEFEMLIMLIDAYEKKHHAIAPPDPIEAIRFRMDQMGLDVKDVAEIIHSRPNRVYEVLARKRPLTLSMIRRFNKDLAIPADSLIADYATL
jgi:HTH-type transcriptional regulator/antitoxin HigA